MLWSVKWDLRSRLREGKGVEWKAKDVYLPQDVMRLTSCPPAVNHAAESSTNTSSHGCIRSRKETPARHITQSCWWRHNAGWSSNPGSLPRDTTPRKRSSSAVGIRHQLQSAWPHQGRNCCSHPVPSSSLCTHTHTHVYNHSKLKL